MSGTLRHMSGNTQRATSPQIPESANAIMGLLNSRPHAHYPDTLADPGTDAAAAVLRPFGQTEDAAPAQLLEQVRGLRDDLLAVLDAEGDEEARRAWSDFTARTSTAVFQQDFGEPGQVRLRQALGEPVVGRIALDVAELVAAGAWSRIRSCANDACRSVFYDVTRSRTQRWHSYELCGNRANVAAYRSRAARSGSAAGG